MLKIIHYIKSLLLVVGIGLALIGYIAPDLTLLLLGVMGVFLSNLIEGILNWKKYIVNIFFHITMFTFLLSRPVISMVKGYEWWYLGEEASFFALSAILISLLSIRVGSKFINQYILAKEKVKPTPTCAPEFLKSLQLISLIAYIVCMVACLVGEAEKLILMQGKEYVEFYTSYKSQLPGVVSALIAFMPYTLCIYLATLPSKRKSFLVLSVYVFSAIPSLIVGVRNPIVLNIIFAAVYYLLRDILENSNKWFGKFERFATVLVLPTAIIFLSAYNYLREGVSVEMGVWDRILDFFYKQGVSFDVLCRGYNAIPDLPDVVAKNYTFGGIIDYFKFGSIAQLFFGVEPMVRGNNEIYAIYGSSFAHSLSYVAHPNYLNGSGWGSSYLLETYADWGYLGIIIFGIILGILMVLMVTEFKRSTLWQIIILMCLTTLFFIPRAEATAWLNFIFTMRFWAIVIVCYFSAIVLTKNYNRQTIYFYLQNKARYYKDMLKNFGLIEILYGVKRFIAIIIAVTVVFGVAGFLSTEKQKPVEAKPRRDIICVSRSYLVTAKQGETEQLQSEKDLTVANTLSAMLSADFSKEYVLEELMKKYSKEDILSYTGSADSNKELDYSVLNSSVSSAVVKNTGIINFFVKSHNEEFSGEAVSYVEDYLLNVASEQVSQLDNLTFLGGTTVTEKAKVGKVAVNSASPKKNAVIFAIIGFVLSICGVLAFVLFKPTVATKKDYEEYNLTVLDDIANHSSSDFGYAIEMIMNNVGKNSYSSVAVVSTVNSVGFNKKYDAFVNKLQADEGEKCSFVKVENINSNFDNFKTAKANDAVILVERKGETYHSNIANTISLLEKNEVSVMGVVLI